MSNSHPRGYAFEFFLDHLALERGLSDATLSAYEHDVGKAVEFFLSRGIGHPASVALGDVRDWVTELIGAGLAPSTIRRAQSALRTYFGFLLDEGVVESDPTERLDAPRLTLTLPHFLTPDEMEALLASPDPTSRLYWRDVAIIEVMYATGVRVSELTQLSLFDLHETEGFLRVLGKGSKERIVPLGGPALTALRRYLRELRPKLAREKTERRIFLGARGGPLRREIVWRMLKSLAARAGIPTAKVHPHTLRHTFATHLIEGGADLVIVQELLGHADIGTTQIYTHLDRSHLFDVHDRCHPRARLG
ncbi:MAG: site-specific tyrosine recombinase XerD [Gemmatimonadetes bacterium]|nr:site-specific tyrosine recombinase XerD [Gemmatimonadota bacterium]